MIGVGDCDESYLRCLLLLAWLLTDTEGDSFVCLLLICTLIGYSLENYGLFWPISAVSYLVCNLRKVGFIDLVLAMGAIVSSLVRPLF